MVIEDNRFELSVPNEPDLPAISVYNGANTILQHNDFVNTRYALFTSAIALHAENNWWGHNSGPYHAELNPSGQGDTIVGTPVDFEPWFVDTTAGARDPSRPEHFELEIYPNPFNQTIIFAIAGITHDDFEIALYDLLGQVVDVIHRGALTGGQIHYQAPPHLASGVYLLSARDKQSVQTKKVILLK
jgi:hypothetical protein